MMQLSLRPDDRRCRLQNSAANVAVFCLLIPGAVRLCAQQQPVQQKQQSKLDQRMLYQHVYRHDQETMLEDPSITNQVTEERVLPDSNEQNVESREVTLDDFHKQRFVPAPVPAQGMHFVPGRGYVAGRTEEGTEPGLSVLAPALGFHPSGGLVGGQDSSGEPSFAIDSVEGSSAREAEANPYVKDPDPLLGLDPFHAEGRSTGIGSALERRPVVSPPVREPSMRQSLLPESVDRAAAGNLSANSALHSSAGMGRITTACQFRVDPATIHDRAELERLSRQGCLTRATSSSLSRDSGPAQ